MDRKTKNRIIDDLLQNRPKGPPGVKVIYTTKEDWDYHRHQYRLMQVPDDDNFGYSDDALFSLDIFDSEQARTYIRERFFDGKNDWELGRRKATITRRTNRLWGRIKDAIIRVKHRGGKGIYEVKRRYSRDIYGYLFAVSKEEAQRSSQLFFGYLTKDNGLSTAVEFVRFGTPLDLLNLNKSVQSSYNNKIEQAMQSIKIHKDRITQWKAEMETLQMVEDQQIAVEGNIDV